MTEKERAERELQLKKEVKENIFKINTYWEIKVKVKEETQGAFYDKKENRFFKWFKYFDENEIPKSFEEGANIVNETIINNAGVAKMVKKQCIIFGDVVDREEIKLFCIEIILKAIKKFKLRPDAIKEKEENLIYAYILECIDKQIKDYIDKERGTYKIVKEGEEISITPKNIMSYDIFINDDPNNDDTYKDFISDDDSLFKLLDGYEQSETYKQIISNISNKLNDDEIALLNLLAFTVDYKNATGNNAKVGRMLKARDIREYGKAKRKSEEAYRVYVSRQKSKIVKKIKGSMKASNIIRLSEIVNLKEDIKNLLDDPTERDILIYAKENINKPYIESIIYNLNVETRKYFIHNFVNDFKENKIKNKETIKICRLIISGLYKLMDSIEKEINNINVIDLKGRAIENKDSIAPESKDSKIKYYVFIDKYEQLKKRKKDIEKLGQQKIMVEYTRKNEDYRVESYDTYYLGEFKEKKEVKGIKKARKYKFTDQQGYISNQ